jgi:hypothetical protein
MAITSGVSSSQASSFAKAYKAATGGSGSSSSTGSSGSSYNPPAIANTASQISQAKSGTNIYGQKIGGASTPSVFTSGGASDIYSQAKNTLEQAKASYSPYDASGMYNTDTAKAAKAGIDSQISYLDRLISQSDASTQAQLKGIRDEYASMQAQQEGANKAYQGGVETAGLVSGRARYAPEIQAGIQSGAVNYGLNQLQDIQNKKQKALSDAESAASDRQYKLVAEKASLYNQLLKDERDVTAKVSDEYYKSKTSRREEAKYLTETLAPSLVQNMTGDAATDMAFLQQTAAETGNQVTADELYGSVLRYQDEQNQKRASLLTGDMREYNMARNQGYKGTLQDWILSMQAKKSSIAADPFAAQLPTDDDVFFVTAGMPPTKSADVIKQYARMKLEGKEKAAEKYLNTIVTANLSVGEKTRYTTYTSIGNQVGKILSEVEKFKEANPGVYKSALEQGKKWVGMDKDPMWLSISSKLGLPVAQIRNEFFGASLTPSESSTANEWAPSFKIGSADTMEDIIIKMTNLKEFTDSNRQNMLDIAKGKEWEKSTEQTPTTSTNFSVTTPTGQTFTFKDQASLDKFKKEANL